LSTDTLPALPTLSLPAELTIYTASDTRATWLAWLAAERPDAASDPGDGRCTVHAGAVDQVDAAGVQLLVALSHTLARQQRRLLLLDPSAPLRHACAALGASALLADTAHDSTTDGARDTDTAAASTEATGAAT
jgi:anti-anti-sigma regulatory factor